MSAVPNAAAAAAQASLLSQGGNPISASKIAQAARLIHEADGLLICTGAGMGVASGMGTFRGAAAGVWPPLLKHDPLHPIPFQTMSCPDWFHKPRTLARPMDGVNFGLAFWQFRFQAYSDTPPHDGYRIILDWIASKKAPEGMASASAADGQSNPPLHGGGFSFTSNIDSHWERCGLSADQLLECHGSIAYTQCAGVAEPVDLDAGEKEPTIRAQPRKPRACGHDIWPADSAEWRMEVDPKSDGVKPPFPRCRHCGSLSRPNVLMFDDGDWLSERHDRQETRFFRWMKHFDSKAAGGSTKKLCILEIGAGSAIPTVRRRSESTLKALGQRASLIRLNTEEAHIPSECGGGGRADLENTTSGGRLVSFTQPSIDVLKQMELEVNKLRGEVSQEKKQDERQ